MKNLLVVFFIIQVSHCIDRFYGMLPETTVNRAASSLSVKSMRTPSRNLESDPDDTDSILYFTDISRPQTNHGQGHGETRTNSGSARLTAIEGTKSKKNTKRQGLSPLDVKREIYRRECSRLKVVPVSAYLKEPAHESLILRHYNIGPNGAKALSAPMMLDKNITAIDIAGNSIGPKGLEFLLEALSDNENITHMNLSQNSLFSDGAQMLGDFIKRHSSVECLILSDNGFKDEDAKFFSRALKINRSLNELVLSHNLFDATAGKLFGIALGVNESLESFDLSWNRIRQRGAALFAEGFADNVGLKKLNISFNGFGTEGTSKMATALQRNRTLLTLDISHNRIKDIDAAALAKKLVLNDTLKTLLIGDNLITSGGATILLQCLHDPESLCQVDRLDMRNTGVDMIFYEMLQEVKDKKIVEVTYGKLMRVGEPVKKRVKKKVGFKSKSAENMKDHDDKTSESRPTLSRSSLQHELTGSDTYGSVETVNSDLQSTYVGQRFMSDATDQSHSDPEDGIS